MIIPTFYGDSGEKSYFNARLWVERGLRTFAGRELTLEELWKLDEYMETLKRRVSSSFEDRALESMVEGAHSERI